MSKPTEKRTLADDLRYVVYVAWLHGRSAGSIATSSGTLSRKDVERIIERSPYKSRSGLGFPRQQQFLADLYPLRKYLGPKIPLRMFMVSKEIPTSDEPVTIPNWLYPEVNSIFEVMAHHFAILGNEKAARAAQRKAKRPGYDGRIRALERYGDTEDLVDINASLHSYMVNRGLYGEPDFVHYPITGAGMIRRHMVERFVTQHEVREMSPVGTPEWGLFVDGGGGGKSGLTLRQYEAVQEIGRWKVNEAAYSALTRWFINDDCHPPKMDLEIVRGMIDAVAVADGAILPSVFQRRWQSRAA